MGLTSIPWADYTLNEWIGCSKVSPGCQHCYAAERDKRHLIEKVDHWGKGAPRYRTSESTRMAPYRWNRRPWICDGCGKSLGDRIGHMVESPSCESACKPSNPPGQLYLPFHRARVFLGSLMDIFDPEVPIEWLADALQTVNACKELDFLFVTKRPEFWQHRMADVVAFEINYRGRTAFADYWIRGEVPANVWMITSTENQKRADERIPHLLRIPAAVHGLSCEPLLGPIDLTMAGATFTDAEGAIGEPGLTRSFQRGNIDWVIAGGESGPSARPMNVAWMLDIQRQCANAGIPYFAKQFGSYCITDNANLLDWDDRLKLEAHGVGFAAARIKFPADNPKGEKMKDWPEELRVRQWPTTTRKVE